VVHTGEVQGSIPCASTTTESPIKPGLFAFLNQHYSAVLGRFRQNQAATGGENLGIAIGVVVASRSPRPARKLALSVPWKYPAHHQSHDNVERDQQNKDPNRRFHCPDSPQGCTR
jgi:hypothetical protein